jgi:hypothetical protein
MDLYGFVISVALLTQPLSILSYVPIWAEFGSVITSYKQNGSLIILERTFTWWNHMD